MTIERIKTGLRFLDDAVGGVYLGLPALVKGARNSGKTVLAAHFVDRVLRLGEKVVLFCETAPEAVILEARSAGIDLEPAARSGQLLLVPLRGALAPARGGFPFDAALGELHSLASRSGVGFAVFSSTMSPPTRSRIMAASLRVQPVREKKTIRGLPDGEASA